MNFMTWYLVALLLSASASPVQVQTVMNFQRTDCNGTTTIDVVDATGAIVMTTAMMSNATTSSIHASMLPVGTYMMVVRDGISTRRTRFNITR